MTTISRKCHAYAAYWRSGTEQRRHGVFPRVVWVLPDDRRRQQIDHVIGQLPTEYRRLFAVCTASHATAVLLGGEGGQE